MLSIFVFSLGRSTHLVRTDRVRVRTTGMTRRYERFMMFRTHRRVRYIVTFAVDIARPRNIVAESCVEGEYFMFVRNNVKKPTVLLLYG